MFGLNEQHFNILGLYPYSCHMEFNIFNAFGVYRNYGFAKGISPDLKRRV